MSAARHFFASGSMSDAELTRDITADITASRSAQRDLAAAGQYGAADRMGHAVDDHLDELNSLNNGTWQPRHA